MTFDAAERSAHQGEPVELYEFLVSPIGRIAPVIFRGHEDDDVTASYGAVVLDQSTVGTDPAPTFHPSGQIASFRCRSAVGLGGFNGSVTYPATLAGLEAGKVYRCSLGGFSFVPTGGGSGPFAGLTLNGGATIENPTGGVLTGLATADGSGEIDVTFAVTGFQTDPFETVHALTFGQLIVQAVPVAEGGTDETAPATETAYRYTSAGVNLTYDGKTFLKADFRRDDEFKVGVGESSRSELRVAIPRAHEFALIARSQPPGSVIHARIYALHRSDLTQARVPQDGELARVEHDGPSCILVLSGKGKRLDRRLVTLVTGRNCPNVLGDLRCRVFLPQYSYTGGIVTAIDGRVVTVSGAADFSRPAADPSPETYFERGTLQAPSGLQVTIEAVDPLDGDKLTLAYLPPGLAVDDLVALAPACDQTAPVCHRRYGNIRNHLGEPAMPVQNPFGPGGLAGVV